MTQKACPEPRRRMRLVVWSDAVCPFCYLAEPALEPAGGVYG